MEAAGLRPTILRQLNEALKTPEERGEGFSVVGVPVAQVVIQGGKFLKPVSSSTEKNIWMSKEFSFEIAIGAPDVFKQVVPRKGREVTFFKSMR